MTKSQLRVTQICLLSIISDVICFVFVLLFIPSFNALSDNFYVSRKLVAVPINFVTQLRLKECYPFTPVV